MISIITATFNSQDTIVNTLESILNQTDTNFEYIIIDGKSNDNTLKIINQYKLKFELKKIQLTIISEKDKGIYDAWNKGIKIAKGNWVSFIGSDDSFYPDAIENYNNIVKQHRNLEYISSKVELIENKKLIKIIDGIWDWRVFRKYMNVAHVGSLHSKNYFKKYGNYNTNYKIAGDYELLLRAKDKLKYYFLNKFTVKMDANGISNDQIYNTLLETKRAKIQTGGINVFSANFYFIWALFKAKFKTVVK